MEPNVFVCKKKIANHFHAKISNNFKESLPKFLTAIYFLIGLLSYNSWKPVANSSEVKKSLILSSLNVQCCGKKPKEEDLKNLVFTYRCSRVDIFGL